MSWVTPEEVQQHLGLKPYDEVDSDHLGRCASAVDAFIARTRPDVAREGVPLPADMHIGGIMLAARWYRRRNNDSSASFQEFGAPLPTIDRDVEQLLGVGRSQGPVIA